MDKTQTDYKSNQLPINNKETGVKQKKIRFISSKPKDIHYDHQSHIKSTHTSIENQPHKQQKALSKEKSHRTVSLSKSTKQHESVEIKEEDSKLETAKNSRNCYKTNQVSSQHGSMRNKTPKKHIYLSQQVENKLQRHGEYIRQKKKEIQGRCFQSECSSYTETNFHRINCSMSTSPKEKVIKGYNDRNNKSKKAYRRSNQSKLTDNNVLSEEMSCLIESRKKLSDYYLQKEIHNASFTFNKNNCVKKEVIEKNCVNTINQSLCNTAGIKKRILPDGKKANCVSEPNKGKGGDWKPQALFLKSNNQTYKPPIRTVNDNINKSQKYNFDYKMLNIVPHHQQTPSFKCIHNDGVNQANYIVTSPKENKSQSLISTAYPNCFSEIIPQMKLNSNNRLNDLEQIKLLSSSIRTQNHNQLYSTNNSSLPSKGTRYLRHCIHHPHQCFHTCCCSNHLPCACMTHYYN